MPKLALGDLVEDKNHAEYLENVQQSKKKEVPRSCLGFNKEELVINAFQIVFFLNLVANYYDLEPLNNSLHNKVDRKHLALHQQPLKHVVNMYRR